MVLTMMYIFLETLMQTWGQKVALKHVHLPMSTAAFILTPLSPPTHMGVRHMAPCPPLTTSLHGLSHMLSSISKCVVADQDTIKTLDHLPVHAGTDGAFFHPHEGCEARVGVVPNIVSTGNGPSFEA